MEVDVLDGGGLAGQPGSVEVLDIAVLRVEEVEDRDVQAEHLPIVGRTEIHECRGIGTLIVRFGEGIGAEVAHSDAARDRPCGQCGTGGDDVLEGSGDPILSGRGVLELRARIRIGGVEGKPVEWPHESRELDPVATTAPLWLCRSGVADEDELGLGGQEPERAGQVEPGIGLPAGTDLGTPLARQGVDGIGRRRFPAEQTSLADRRNVVRWLITAVLFLLMLAAQAYQESELDHDKVSRAGARGIMQVKSTTAADPNVGIEDISGPADNIRAGARYMRFMMDRYFADEGIEPLQSWLFALAAYNAGPARIQQLRSQAAQEGYERNLWVDNVEIIADRKIGRETVRYVRNVFTYYVAYRLAVEAGERRRNLSIN